MLCKKIKSIKKIGVEKVYDIKVENNNNFFLENGILSHNSEVKGMISGQDDLTLINEMTSPQDRSELCDPYIRDRRMQRRHLQYLFCIPIHETVAICRGKKAELLKRVMPPRTMSWKPTLGNFMLTWKTKYNEWISTNTFYRIIDDMATTRREEIQDKYEQFVVMDEKENSKKSSLLEMDEDEGESGENEESEKDKEEEDEFEKKEFDFA